MDPRLATHLSKGIIEDIQEGDTEVKALRMVRGVVKVTLDDYEPRYFYRGFEIEEHTSTPKGYFGRWSFGSLRGWHADSMAACVTEIDRRLGSQS